MPPFFIYSKLFASTPTLPAPSAAQSRVHVDDIGTVSEKGNVVEGIRTTAAYRLDDTCSH